MTAAAVSVRTKGRQLLGDRRLWAAVTALVTAALYASTLQVTVNGVVHPYTTDVGEIQNALPRWGTIHYPGYPLYSLLGSLLVTVLRLVGVPPAAGASVFSALWGVMAALLIYALACELGAAAPWSALGSLVAGLSTSLWMDSSLAEIHTMGAALLLAVLYAALRFGRHGRQRDLRLLALAWSVGVMHQRTLLFLAPAVLLLVWGRWAEIRRGLLPALALAAIGPLTYLYLPIRAWQGASWTFGAVGTWEGFLQIFLDTKVDRIIALPQDVNGWLARLRVLAQLLHDDLWLPVLAAGLLGGLALPWRHSEWHKPVALTLAWLPSVPLSLAIWEGSVSDALLAAKLPLALLAGVGLALAAQAAMRIERRTAPALAVALVAVIGLEVHSHRPPITAITHDTSASELVARAEQVAHPSQPATFMALWGQQYWALAYAQAYQGGLQGLAIVDHNADVAVITRNGRLLTFAETLYHRPLNWWDERLGRAYLSSPAPSIVAIRPAPASGDVPEGPGLDLGNGIRILSSHIEPGGNGEWALTVYWRADRPPDADYSVAVHVLTGTGDVLSQADSQHPVCGWYPTTRWEPGEIVRDSYLLTAPAGAQPAAVRIAMYRTLEDGQFSNTAWLTLPLAPQPGT